MKKVLIRTSIFAAGCVVGGAAWQILLIRMIKDERNRVRKNRQSNPNHVNYSK